MKFFSVIITLHKFDKRFIHCLLSATNQDSNNYEILVCTEKLRYREEKKLEYFINNLEGKEKIKILKKNKKEIEGVSTNRNLGILNCKGDYIIFLDSDDLLIYNSIKKIEKEILSTNKKYNLFVSNFIYNRPAGKFTTQDFKYNNKSNFFLQIKDINNFTSAIWRFVIKREFLIKNKILFETALTIHEDVLFIIKILCKEKSVFCLKNIFYIYNYNKNSLINKEYYKINKLLVKNFLVLLNKISLILLLKFKNKLLKKFILKKFITFLESYTLIKISINLHKKKLDLKFKFSNTNFILKKYYYIDSFYMYEKILLKQFVKIIKKNKYVIFARTLKGLVLANFLKKNNIKFYLVDANPLISNKTYLGIRIYSHKHLHRINNITQYNMICSSESNNTYSYYAKFLNSLNYSKKILKLNNINCK